LVDEKSAVDTDQNSHQQTEPAPSAGSSADSSSSDATPDQYSSAEQGRHTLFICTEIGGNKPFVDGIESERVEFKSASRSFPFGSWNLNYVYKVSGLPSGVYHVGQDVGDAKIETCTADLTMNRDAAVSFKLGQSNPEVSYGDYTGIPWAVLIVAVVSIAVGFVGLWFVAGGLKAL